MVLNLAAKGGVGMAHVPMKLLVGALADEADEAASVVSASASYTLMAVAMAANNHANDRNRHQKRGTS